MFGIGIFELIVIAVVALVFVGPKRLPELMRQGGKLFVQLRRTANDVKSQFDGVISQAEEEIRKVEREKFLKLLEVQQELHKPVVTADHEKVPDHPTVDYVPFEGAAPDAASTDTSMQENVTQGKSRVPSFDTGAPKITAPAPALEGPSQDTEATSLSEKKQEN